MRAGIAVCLVVVCQLLALAQQAHGFTAEVLSVNDGDTCRVRRDDGRHYRLRLFGIDAPESDQPYGPDAGDVLRALIDGRDIEVQLTGARTYGRRVARIFVDDYSVSEAMVAEGWAWHYDRYTTGAERARLTQAEQDARNGRTGLWASDNPIRPECWRRGDRDGDCQPDFQPFAASRFSRTSASQPRQFQDGGVAELARSQPARLTPVDRFRRFMEQEARPRAALPPEAARARDEEAGHAIYGFPQSTDNRFRFTPPGQSGEVSGITQLTRTAFTVGHYDRFRLPAWVAVTWSKDDFERGVNVSLPRPSPKRDLELPAYARGGTSFEHSQTGLQRGHMARDDDMESWGPQAVAEAMRMSNMVPQLQGRNHAVWTLLENEHKHIVANDEDEFEIDRVWIVAGPVFFEDSPDRRVGQPGTRVPDATYKLIAWFTPDGEFQARAYVVEQLAEDVDLWEYLAPVDHVEAMTGLDFFPEMNDGEEDELESNFPATMWE